MPIVNVEEQGRLVRMDEGLTAAIATCVHLRARLVEVGAYDEESRAVYDRNRPFWASALDAAAYEALDGGGKP